MARLIALLVLIALCADHPADARHVIRLPKVRTTCRQLSSWPAAVTCMSRFGEVRPLRNLPKAHVVAVAKRDDGIDLYIFLLGSDGQWRYAGEIDDERSLVAFSSFTVPDGVRYRADLVRVFDSAVVFEDRSVVASKTTMHSSMFCAPDQIDGCSVVVTRCEERVRGKTVHLFVGDLTLDKGVATVRGDTSKVGSCNGAPQTVTL